METETGLHAGVIGSQAPHRYDGAPQLQRVGGVLSVVDGAHLPFGGQEAVVARLGLGARLAGGHVDNPQVITRLKGLSGFGGLVVVRLQEELDVE